MSAAAGDPPGFVASRVQDSTAMTDQAGRVDDRRRIDLTLRIIATCYAAERDRLSPPNLAAFRAHALAILDDLEPHATSSAELEMRLDELRRILRDDGF